jgi:AbrB family looped-hinge helix DNA binding protein
MKRTVVSKKGQVVLPKAIRERRRWAAGTELVVEDRPDGVLLKVAETATLRSVADLAGILKYDGPPRSVEEMNNAIDAEFRRRHARRRY